MRQNHIVLALGIVVLFGLPQSSWVLAQAIKPLSGTKGANAVNQGVYQFNQGHLNKALSQFQTALKANPRSAVAHYNLGLTYNRLGQSDKAQTHFKKAQELGRGNPFIQHSSILKHHLQGIKR